MIKLFYIFWYWCFVFSCLKQTTYLNGQTPERSQKITRTSSTNSCILTWSKSFPESFYSIDLEREMLERSTHLHLSCFGILSINWTWGQFFFLWPGDLKFFRRDSWEFWHQTAFLNPVQNSLHVFCVTKKHTGSRDSNNFIIPFQSFNILSDLYKYK